MKKTIIIIAFIIISALTASAQSTSILPPGGGRSADYLYQKGQNAYSRSDYVEAFKWFRQAAEKDLIQAFTKVGDMYRDGLGVAKSNIEAMKWYELAIAKGDKSRFKELEKVYSSYGPITIKGKVTDKTGTPVAKCSVVCNGKEVLTDKSGNWRIDNIQLGSHVLLEYYYQSRDGSLILMTTELTITSKYIYDTIIEKLNNF